MKVNKKLIIGVIFILGLAWIFNAGFYMSRKIDGPVFTYSYCSNQRIVQLSYLMNESDDDKVIKIILPELNNAEFDTLGNWSFDNYFMVNGNVQQSIDDDGSPHYKKNDIAINLDQGYYPSGEEYNFENLSKDDINITKIKYLMESGKTDEVEIGSIKFDKTDVEIDRGYDLFVHYGSSTLYQDKHRISESTFIAKDDLQIVGVEGILETKMAKNCIIKINGEEVNENSFPISIKNTETITVSSEMKYPFYFNSNFDFKIIVRDPEGTEDKITVPNDFINQGYTAININDVDELLEMRGLK